MVAFAGAGAWVCLPALDSGGGSAAGAQEAGLKTADQSLDSAENPSGAAGSAIDPSMPQAKKKSDSELASSLYQAPGSAAVAASTAAFDAGPTFADALKDITRASSAKATVSASASKGGWSETPQRGFTAPKGNFGAMSGFGGGSGTGASASAGGGPAGAPVSGFGGKGPNTGVSFTKGLKDDGSAAVPGVKGVMGSLEKAKAASVAAAFAGSNDAARAGSGATFDGGAGSAGRVGSSQAAAQGASAGLYGKLDAAPMNLKANPDLIINKSAPVPKPTPMPPQKNEMQQMMMQMMMSVAMAGVMALL